MHNRQPNTGSRGLVGRGLFAMSCMVRRFHADMVMRLASLRSRQLRVTCGPTLIVAPHQDDETFGCGGLIALKRLAGVPVQIVFLTDGSQSHHDHDDRVPADLLATRRREAMAALRILGIDRQDVHFLDYPDGALHELGPATRARMVSELADLMRACGAAEVFLPHRNDRHLDHEAAHGAVAEAAAAVSPSPVLLQYSIWMPWRSPLLWRMGLRDLSNASRLDIDPVRHRKLKAIDAYRSQQDVLPWGFVSQFRRSYEMYFGLAQPSRTGVQA